MKTSTLTAAFLAALLSLMRGQEASASETIYDYCPAGFTVQSMMQRRAEVARLADVYRRNGMGENYAQARQQIMNLDKQIYSAYLDQWINNINLTGDPSCAVLIFNLTSSVKISVIPNGIMWDILVANRITRKGVSTRQLFDILRDP